MLAKVSGTTTTSHAGDGAFEVGPPIGVLRIDETLTQVRRVLQAFLQPVRQFVNVVDRAVAHVVMAHSSSRGMWSENIAPSRTEAVQNSTGPNRSTDADDKPQECHGLRPRACSHHLLGVGGTAERVLIPPRGSPVHRCLVSYSFPLWWIGGLRRLLL